MAYVEIVRDDGSAATDREEGEVVVTTFSVEAMPLVRYRTGDISFLDNSRCPCERAGARLGPILGRKSHRLKVGGTTIYPQAVIDVLDSHREIEDYLLILTNLHPLSDRIEVKLVLTNTHRLQAIGEHLRGTARFLPELMLCDRKELDAIRHSAGNRKKSRVLDLRSSWKF